MEHKPSTYPDGWRRVEFCSVCGAEGDELRLECVGNTEPDPLEEKLKNLWKNVDTKKRTA